MLIQVFDQNINSKYKNNAIRKILENILHARVFYERHIYIVSSGLHYLWYGK